MPARRPRSPSRLGPVYRYTWPIAAAFWVVLLVAAARTALAHLLGI